MIEMNLLEIISLCFSAIFLVVVISYYVLLFKGHRKNGNMQTHKSISIIIPAHNEERYIAECIRSVQDAVWAGKKQIIVVDDGSVDQTAIIASRFKVILVRTRHRGKSAALNEGLLKAKGFFIAVVDGDSIIEKYSLAQMSCSFSEDVAAATGVVKVKNRKSFLCMWLHIEQLFNSLIRSVFSKVNANITLPGPLSMYRRSALKEIGGFSTEGFSEDADVTIRLIRKGYKAVFCEKSFAYTYMPEDVKGVIRQRMRFSKGTVNLLKRHMKVNNAAIDIYTLPLLLFFYVQAIIMGGINLIQIFSGYGAYFLSKGIIFSFGVLQFLFEWFSLIGFFKWVFSIALGNAPISFLSALVIISALLSYPLYFYAIIKYDGKIDLWHIIPILFMFPFWIFVTFIYLLSIPETFKKNQYNRWKKNE